MSTKYGDAAGYDQYMGGWSAALSPPFLAFAAAGEVDAVLDIGCGTGNLLAAVAAAYPRARPSGVDPSEALLARARTRPELAGATLVTGRVEALPFGDHSFSHTLSMLVLQEFPDRDLALQQMRRVTRPGGVVAACQWDFLHMPVITSLVKSIAAVDAVAGERLGQRGMPVFGDEQELAECWSLAGLVEVAGGRLEVKRTFASFEALWRPLLAGSTPSTLTLASFDEDKRAAVRSGMMERLGIDDPQAPLELLSEAIVVKGRRAD